MTNEQHTLASGAASSLSHAILKLVEVLEEENSVLREHRIASHAGFTDRKNQYLRELMAAQRSVASGETARSCNDLLQRLSASLHINAGLLKLHITAVGEMSDIIIGSLREAESDGTYSRSCRIR